MRATPVEQLVTVPTSMRRHDGVRFVPDPSRVILRPFLPGSSLLYDGSERIDAVLERLLALTDAEVTSSVESVSSNFSDRHRPDEFERALAEHFAHVAGRLDLEALTDSRRRLIAMYFTHEYSIEAAALGNPSMVPAPDQSGLQPGEMRVIMSLRSVGEGHRSSISFRTGVIDGDLEISFEPASEYVSSGRRSSAIYDRTHFRQRLCERSMLDDFGTQVLDEVGERFEKGDLDRAIHSVAVDGDDVSNEAVARYLTWIADSNYLVDFEPTRVVSERVLFPSGPAETHGMEDARFVRFVDADGAVRYYGTYTAYDGRDILPQLIETADFAHFRVSTLRGSCAQNKGIALFPRQIDGDFVALGRHDNVNNFLMRSASIREWNHSEVIQEPSRPWELTQLGNCGSPIETEAGWLVITHGVGAMRRYTIGALLLDLDDPMRVTGHLRDPLLEPDESERDGYVPNVVYSCGATLHQDHLILPYGFSDFGASVASIPLDSVLDRLVG